MIDYEISNKDETLEASIQNIQVGYRKDILIIC